MSNNGQSDAVNVDDVATEIVDWTDGTDGEHAERHPPVGVEYCGVEITPFPGVED